MKRLLIISVLALLSVNFNTAQAFSVRCNSELSTETRAFAEKLVDYNILFGFADGDIHVLKINHNDMHILTARYGRQKGELFYDQMILRECRDDSSDDNGIIYLEAYKGRLAPNGTYKYPARILIPTYFTPGTMALVDLRQGQFDLAKLGVEER